VSSKDLERRFVDSGGVRLHYAAAGKGPLVVLLHGFPQYWYCWRRVIPRLAERFRVIAPDLRGYGESDKPAAVREYRDELLRADVVALMRNEGRERAHVVGHDWGGGIAHSLAIHDPERVEKLVILNCPHPQAYLATLKRDRRQLLRSWYVAFFQLPWLPERLLTLGAPWLFERAFRGTAVNPEAFSDDDLARYVAAIRIDGAARAGINYYRAAFNLAEIRSRKGPLRKISAPTLVLWGERDPWLGASLLKGIERYFTGSLRVQRLPDSSHWVPDEQPERVAQELLNFLG